MSSTVVIVHRADAHPFLFCFYHSENVPSLNSTASVIFIFKRTSKSQKATDLCTKHSEGALFLIVDLCNPLVITHVTFASRTTVEKVRTDVLEYQSFLVERDTTTERGEHRRSSKVLLPR
jgi:hypothetical protein